MLPLPRVGTLQDEEGSDDEMRSMCKELVAGMQRFCGEECRGVFMERLKHGTRSAPGRSAAKRRRKRGR